MSNLVTVQQAANNALVAWIQSQVPSDWFVDSRWPDPDRALPPKSVTVLMAGALEWTPIDPHIVGGPFQNPQYGQPPLFTWFLRCGIQPLQLDIWANTDVARDDMIARLEPVLNAGFAATGLATNADPFRNGVALKLGDCWDSSIADFVFLTPDVTDDPQSVSRGEYRATYQGQSAFNLTLSAPSVTIANIRLSMQLGEFITPPQNQPYDRFTIPSANTGPEFDESYNTTP